jgi:rRNA-processing protein FCF1
VINDAVSLTAANSEVLPAYLGWAIRAVNELQRHLRSSDVDRLVRTPTFWSALNLRPESPATVELINGELLARQDALRDALDSIESFRRRFLSLPEESWLLIADTNVLIAHAESARDTDWHGMSRQHVRLFDTVRLVIPLLVIDERDKLKDHGKDQTRTRARAMLKLIHSIIGDTPGGRSVLQSSSEEHGPVTIEILMESPTHVRLPRADDELVDVAARLRDMLGDRTVFTTFDTGADLRAAVKRIHHTRLEHAH